MVTPRYFSTVVLIIASVFFLYDIISELFEDGNNVIHVLVECFMLIGISVVLFLEMKRVIQLRKNVEIQKQKVARLSGELYKVINNQFSEWGLTYVEKEIALFLIKGLSMKEIADIRNVKEKTIRQQSMGLYAKSGYTGRHELASHFIEDLLNLGNE
jgi:DNA-binding CsgD family transcriptional regulator